MKRSKLPAMNVQHATTVSSANGRYAAVIDPEWCIWGPIGGYVAAIAMRAVGLAVPAGHRPVTLSCQFLAKADAGTIEIIVEPLKSGSTAFFNVRLLQNDTVFFQAQICTTAKQEGPSHIDARAPEVPRPDALESFAAQLVRFGHTPMGFWTNVDGRQVDFRPPGDPDPRGCRTECWMRFEEWQVVADPFLDAVRALILIDTNIWRAYNRGQSELPKHVAPSLDLTVWFHDAAPESQWQLVDAHADYAGHALLNGSARIWSEDGRLVASGGGQCLFVPLRRD
jgi:acyl-CoA thioesterase II